VHEKHKKHEPQIGEDDEELPELLIGSCSQAFLLLGRLANLRGVDFGVGKLITRRACGERGGAFA